MKPVSLERDSPLPPSAHSGIYTITFLNALLRYQTGRHEANFFNQTFTATAPVQSHTHTHTHTINTHTHTHRHTHTHTQSHTHTHTHNQHTHTHTQTHTHTHTAHTHTHTDKRGKAKTIECLQALEIEIGGGCSTHSPLHLMANF